MVASAAWPRTCDGWSGGWPVSRPSASTHTVTALSALAPGSTSTVPACRVPSGAVDLAGTASCYWRYPSAGAVAASAAGTWRKVAC